MGTKNITANPEPKPLTSYNCSWDVGCRRVGAAEHGQDSSHSNHGHGSGASEHVAEEKLAAWMDAHRKPSLQDAGPKQYDNTVESARQFGCSELSEVFTGEKKNDAD